MPVAYPRVRVMSLPVLVLSAFMGLCSPTSASWTWLPRTQVTRAGSSELPWAAGIGLDEGEPGKTSGVRYHQLLRAWGPTESANNGHGLYIRIGSDADIAAAWANREEVTPSPYQMTDLSFAANPDDEAFLAAETFGLEWADPDPQPRIGFRHRTSTGWGPLVIISADSVHTPVNTPAITRVGGTRVAGGVYFLRAEGGGFAKTRKVVLLP